MIPPMTEAAFLKRKHFRQEYWRSRYSDFLKNAAECSSEAWRLRAICYTAWPLIFNRVMAFFESFFVSNLLARARIDLKSRAVLDLGCGTGRWCQFYDRCGAQITGLDISEEIVAYNRKIFPGWTFIASDILKLPYPADFFDFVNAVIVLEYVPNAEKQDVLKELDRILKPGGTLLVLDPVSQNQSRENTEASCLSVPEWEKLFRNARFEMLAQQPLHAYPLVGGYRQFSKMLGGMIKTVKAWARQDLIQAKRENPREKDEIAEEVSPPRRKGAEPVAAWRHRFYHELDQWILRVLACFSLPVEWIYLRIAGKGSHQLFLLQKPLSDK